MADAFENEPVAVETEDGGIIRCICDVPEDDGSTIQCDVCDVWQHFLCIDIDENNVPDEYLCDECSPRVLDALLARDRQAKRSAAEQHLKMSYPASVVTSELEMQIKAASRAYALGELELDLSVAPEPQEYPSPQQLPPPAAPSSRKRSATNNSSASASAQQQQHENLVGQPPAAKKKRKSRQSAQGTPSYAQGPTTPGLEASTSRRPSVLPVPVDEDDRQESWVYGYTHLQEPIWDDPEAVEQVRLGLQTWFARLGQPCHVRARRVKNAPGSLPTHRLQWTRTPAPEEETGFFAAYSEEEDFGLCAPVAPRYHHESKQKLASSTSRIVVRNIPSTSFSLAPPLSTPFTPSNTFTAPTLQCPYPRPIAQALYAKSTLPTGNFITPFYGSVVSRKTYMSVPSNQYDTLGVPKPGVRALPLPWSIMIDARQYGNEVRFARSGCLANAVVRPIIHNTVNISPTEEGFDVAFGLYATRDIAKKEEIVVSWDWDDHHLIHLLPRLLFEPEFRASIPLPVYSQQLASISSALLPLAPCACAKRKSCALSWMYRLACCSQPTSLGNNKSRDHLDASLVEEKLQALLMGGGRGGKKGVDLDSINYRRGWEDEPQAPEHELDILRPQTNQTEAEQDQSMDVDDDQKSQVSADSDATEPLSRNEDALRAQEQDTSQMDISRDITGIFEDAPLQKPQTPPAENVQSPADAQEQSDVSVPAQDEPDESVGAPATTMEEGEPQEPAIPEVEPEPPQEPEPEPAKPRTPSPPPIPKAKVSFAAFMKRWKDKPEPAKEPSPESVKPELDIEQEKADIPGLTSSVSSHAPVEEEHKSSPRPHSPEKQRSPSPAGDSTADDEGPVYRPNSPIYRPDSPVYRPDSPLYRPHSPIYRPSSPPATARLPPASPPSHHAAQPPLRAAYQPPPSQASRPTYGRPPPRESYAQPPPERPSYFPSTSSYQYEPTLRSSELRSPSPALPPSATSDRSRRMSPSPPPEDRYQPSYPQGSPPAGPRASSSYVRWAPRSRGRGYGPPPMPASASAYSSREPPRRPPEPPRAPRALQPGASQSIRPPPTWTGSHTSRGGPPTGPGAERGIYRGVPRGPRGSGWRPRGRGG